jgi:hypothetical protein
MDKQEDGQHGSREISVLAIFLWKSFEYLKALAYREPSSKQNI